MNCLRFRQFYSDFADGFCDEADAVAFQVHLAECPACRRFDAALRQGRDTLQHLPAPAPSPDFDNRLYERIVRECLDPPPPALRPWLGAAAAVLVVAAAAVGAWEARGLFVARVPAARPAPQGGGRSATAAFEARFAGDTSIRYPGHLPVIPVSRDTFRSPARPARSFEITVDWMTP